MTKGSVYCHKKTEVCLKLSRKPNCLLYSQSTVVAQKLISNTPARRHSKKTHQIQYRTKISSHHHNFITHFYSRLAVVDFDILFPCLIHFNSNHYQPPLVTSPIFHCCSLLYYSVAQCVLSMYDMTESDLSVVGRSVLKMP